jgi:hypothetical protein
MESSWNSFKPGVEASLIGSSGVREEGFEDLNFGQHPFWQVEHVYFCTYFDMQQRRLGR